MQFQQHKGGREEGGVEETKHKDCRELLTLVELHLFLGTFEQRSHHGEYSQKVIISTKRRAQSTLDLFFFIGTSLQLCRIEAASTEVS